MGLDMHLYGVKEFDEGVPIIEDGFVLCEKIFDLAYWRKHPNLHGYIVNTFADGKDDCTEIYLSEESLADILKAVREKSLPKTSGFFFGETTGEERDRDIQIFIDALAWVRNKKPGEYDRHCKYRASW